MSYTLMDGGKAIRCGRCGRISYNRHDVLARYCGHCHIFHDDEDRKRREEQVRHQRSSDEAVLFTTQRTRDELMQSYDSTPSSSEPVCRPAPTYSPPDLDYGNNSCSGSDWSSSSSDTSISSFD